MSMPVPQKRPAGSSQGMLRRDSKKVKGGLNRHFDRPVSNISLPLEDSIHSSMSSGSESRAWRVSALELISPRPKLRCSVSSQHYHSGARTSPISHDEKHNILQEYRTASLEKDRRNDRVDDLADTLDAGALRAILERDRRRKEKKRKADEERLRRKLERRAEKQRAAERAAQPSVERPGTPSTPRREAVGAVGLGIEQAASRPMTPMEDVRPSTPPQAQRLEAVTPTPKVDENTQLPTPMDSPVRQLPTPLESPMEEPVVADAKAIRYSRASMSSSPQGHTRGPSNVSEMPALLSEMLARERTAERLGSVHDPNTSGSLHPVQTADTTVTSRRGSSMRRSSESGRMGVFSSIFRRGKRMSQDQGRPTPSEVSFSNTSRESMSRQPLPAHLVAPTQPVEIRRPSSVTPRTSSVPRRTMSKFREDLPDFPSPPPSRVQSPEVPTTSVIAARRRSQAPSDLRVSPDSSTPGARTDSPISAGVPGTGVMSQSLASVDSEASWLSGKPMKRISNRSQVRSSVGSSPALQRTEGFNASYEELGIPDDEYFRRLTPQPDDHRSSAQSDDLMARKASSTAMAAMDTSVLSDETLPTSEPSSDEELVKNVPGRQPTIVHRQPRVKSTEGLVSYYQATPAEERTSAEMVEQDSPISESEPVIVQRAKSIDFGKHHTRQLSAGSAKLLDIPARRSSVDPKRTSLSSQNTLSQQ